MRKVYVLILAVLLISISASAIQPQRGYRGFIDWSNDANIDLGFLSVDNEPGDDTHIFTGLTTSHGYQFNDWIYVGGGAGCEYNLDWKRYEEGGEARFIVPVFAEGRLDAKWNRFTPFLSVRLGANLADHGGIYFSPMVGYRFNWGRRSSINLGVGMTLYGRRREYREHVMQPGGGITLGRLLHYRSTDVKFALRVGYEFQLP